jgi:hypothetical protein
VDQLRAALASEDPADLDADQIGPTHLCAFVLSRLEMLDDTRRDQASLEEGRYARPTGSARTVFQPLAAC